MTVRLENSTLPPYDRSFRARRWRVARHWRMFRDPGTTTWFRVWLVNKRLGSYLHRRAMRG